KLMAHKCKVMCTNFESTAHTLNNGVFTGAPIRHELYNGNKHNIINEYKLSPEKSTILVMGGSLGSVNINKNVRAILPDLLKKYNVIHIVGKGNIDETLKQNYYIQIEFTDKISDYFATADVIVSRAGATAIHEFLALRKPMLLIPLSKMASRGDQILNAKNFNERRIANILFEENMSPQNLKVAILKLFSSRIELIKNMSKEPNTDGTKKIYEQILKYSKLAT
ncbi:MAG: glycosyltransferase, partial [Clostridia bacterium]|nr:glycosyltransferase [Clostridia bacterium]